MALYIDSFRNIATWHVGAPLPLWGPGDIQSLQADGDELQWINHLLPPSKDDPFRNRRVRTFRREEAFAVWEALMREERARLEARNVLHGYFQTSV